MYFVVVSKFSGRQAEPSISNMLVSNCSFFTTRMPYQQLPWFTIGDSLYVDRAVALKSLPLELQGIPILAIQTVLTQY